MAPIQFIWPVIAIATLTQYCIIAFLAGCVLIALLSAVIITILCWKKCKRKYPLPTDDEFRRLVARTEQEDREKDKLNKAVRRYLSETKTHIVLEKLNDLGSRLQKYWFLIKSTSNNETCLLTILPVSRNCALQLNCLTISTLDELLGTYAKERPPYINIVHKIDYIPSPEPGSGYVIIIQDWHPKGSLRDTLQNLDPKEDWVKLKDCSSPLPKDKVARYGRQILKALIYLNKEGFPPLAHVHSGNIYIDANDEVRVGGYENTLLGYRTRLHRLFQQHTDVNWDLIDVFMFGHVVYEMATGQSLEYAIPTDEQCSMKDERVTEILKYIFHFNQKRKLRFPITARDAFKKIQKHDFFKDESDGQSKAVEMPRKHTHPEYITALLKRVKEGTPVEQDNDDEYVTQIQDDNLNKKGAKRTVKDYLASSQHYTLPKMLDSSGGNHKFLIKSRDDGTDLLLKGARYSNAQFPLAL